MADNYDLNKDLRAVIEAARRKGADTNLFFTTTLDRYQMQLKMLSELKADIAKRGTVILPAGKRAQGAKIPNPSIAEYNRAATAANQTVRTLLDIIAKLGERSIFGAATESDDEL